MLFTDLVDQTWSFQVSLKSWCTCLISVLASAVSVVRVNDVEMYHVYEESVSSKLKAKSLVYEIFPYMNFVFYLGDGHMSFVGGVYNN